MKKSSFASVLSLARQLLQIIDENANSSDSSFSEIKSKNYKSKEKIYVTKKNEQKNELNNSSQSENNDYYHESNLDLNYYNSQNQNQNEKSKINFFTLTRTFSCKICKTVFSSNNRLHRHLCHNICKKFKHDTNEAFKEKIFYEMFANLAMNILIIEFIVDSSKNVDIDFEFRD